jgi:hypothetical protein
LKPKSGRAQRNPNFSSENKNRCGNNAKRAQNFERPDEAVKNQEKAESIMASRWRQRWIRHSLPMLRRFVR